MPQDQGSEVYAGSIRKANPESLPVNCSKGVQWLRASLFCSNAYGWPWITSLIYAIAAVYLLLLPQISLLPFFLGIKQYFECGTKSHCHFHFGDLLDGMEPHNSICEWPFLLATDTWICEHEENKLQMWKIGKEVRKQVWYNNNGRSMLMKIKLNLLVLI